jgi:hypothetical protein
MEQRALSRVEKRSVDDGIQSGAQAILCALRQALIRPAAELRE